MKRAVLFLSYVIVSWFSGKEFHPFSRYPMYDSFPNYSYSFYVADSSGKLIPYRTNFKTQANEMGHMYSEICEGQHIAHGMGRETPSQLNAVGCEMLTFLKKARKETLRKNTISIHRVYYSFKNGVIVKEDDELCNGKVE